VISQLHCGCSFDRNTVAVILTESLSTVVGDAMATKPTELEKLQAEYQRARQRYRAVAPLGGPEAERAGRAFDEAARRLEQGTAQGQGQVLASDSVK
jgi:hypothetical protein